MLPTKIVIPNTRNDVVERPRLYEVLINNKQKKVTIVQAPAGYGKTTFITQWIKKMQLSAAWLTLDHLDNEPNRFWLFLFKSIAKVCDSNIDEVLTPLIESNQSMKDAFLIDAFLHELSLIDHPLHIVLDDYHLIENHTIHSMVTNPH